MHKLKHSSVRLFTILVILSICSHNASAQWNVTITDAGYGTGIPDAVILVNGIFKSNTSNAQGKIEIPNTITQKFSYPAQIQIVGIGYNSKSITIYSTIVDTNVQLEIGAAFQEIVVTSNREGESRVRLSQSLEVIRPEFIANTQTTQLNQVLAKLPGVNIQKDQMSIRGISGFSYGAGSRILMLLDDMPLLSGDASDVKWAYLPIENFSQVEVLKGPAASLYGSSALEGTIQLRTALPSDTEFVGYRLFASVYDDPNPKSFKIAKSGSRMQFGGNVAYRNTFGKIGLVTSVYQLTDNGYRIGENFNLLRANVRLNGHLDIQKKWLWAGSINGFRQKGSDFVLFGDVASPLTPLAGTISPYDNKRYHLDGSITYYQNLRTSHSLKSRYFKTLNSSQVGNSSNAGVWYLDYLFSKKLPTIGKLYTSLNAGSTFTYTTVTSPTLYRNHSGRNAAAYLELNPEIGRFKFTLGGRYEYYSIDNVKPVSIPVYRLATNVKLTNATFLRMSLAQGFRYPSVAERFSRTQSGAIKIFPNENLNAERGKTFEAGIRQLYKHKRLSGYVDASAFQSRYDNMIEFLFGLYLPDTASPTQAFNYLGFAAQNIKSTQITGFEISTGAKYEYEKGNIQTLIGYTYINPLNKDYNRTVADTASYSQYLKYRRAHTFRANLDASYGRFGFGAYYSAMSGFQNMDLFFIELIKGLKQNNYWQDFSRASIIDFRLSFKFNSKVNLSFNVKNAGNKLFMEVPGNTNAPRTFTLQLSGQF
ncbi:MAG: TonB-dependent receptor [Bacteroidota bacterium]|nr:TonB-dependent receptor [Bacteroidota bacterium]